MPKYQLQDGIDQLTASFGTLKPGETVELPEGRANQFDHALEPVDETGEESESGPESGSEEEGE